MLKDWQFYPIAALLIGAMIIFALSFADTPDPENVKKGFVVEGETFQFLTQAPGTSLAVAGDANNPAAYAVFSANLTREKAGPSAGIFATLGPLYKKAFMDNTIEVSVRARKGRTNPTDEFLFGYFAMGSGTSGWKSFKPSKEFETYSFTFRPELVKDDSRVDYVGIWPDEKGRSRTLDVAWIKVKLSPEPTN
jgi:hypothetical protein